VDNSNKLTVVKSNVIIDAGYRLSIYENRILLTCISQINSMGEVGLNDVFTVTAQDLIGLIGLDGKNTYKQLKKAVDRLYERSVIIDLPGHEVLKVRWVSSVKYVEQSGTVELKFSQDMIPYISQLRREFTQYRLNNVLMFKSNYSIRVYELLVKWSGDHKTVTVEWLKQQFQLETKYTRIGDLKKYVLDIAIKEINQYSDMNVQYSQIKQGRNVTGFKFEYSLKHPQPKKSKHNFNDHIHGISKAEIDKNARVGETYSEAAARLAKLKNNF
jgi:plasmid replication initiation protein